MQSRADGPVAGVVGLGPVFSIFCKDQYDTVVVPRFRADLSVKRAVEKLDNGLGAVSGHGFLQHSIGGEGLDYLMILRNLRPMTLRSDRSRTPGVSLGFGLANGIGQITTPLASVPWRSAAMSSPSNDPLEVKEKRM